MQILYIKNNKIEQVYKDIMREMYLNPSKKSPLQFALYKINKQRQILQLEKNFKFV